MKIDKYIKFFQFSLKMCLFILLLQITDFEKLSNSLPWSSFPISKVSKWLQGVSWQNNVKMERKIGRHWVDSTFFGWSFVLCFLSFQPDLKPIQTLTECVQLLHKLAEEVNNISQVRHVKHPFPLKLFLLFV